MGGASKTFEQVAAAATEVPLIDGVPATRFKLLPMGTIAMRDGRGPYRIRDKAHADEIVAATQAFFGAADMPGDYYHQMLHAVKPGVGGTAEASAWVKTANLTAEEDGIWANAVEWTADAAEKLTSRKYRYISPLFMAAPVAAGGDVAHLKNFALVNIGAIDLPAIAAGLSGEEEDMDLKALAALLGLKPEATLEEIAAAVTEQNTKLAAAPSTSTIAIAAGLEDGATVEAIAAAVATMKTAGAPDPAKFVPIAAFTDATQQLSTLNNERAEREVAAAMGPDVGKVTPAMKSWAIDYFKKDEAGYRAWLDAAPQIVAAGAQLGDRKTTEKRTTLTADEIAACEMTGMSQADFLVAANAQLAEEIA